MNPSIDTTSDDAEFTAALSAWTAANRLRDYQSAEQAAEQVMDRAVELMIAEADANGPSEDILLSLQAKECEERCDWDGAISAYSTALTLADQSGQPFAIWIAHRDLADLYLLLDQNEEAERHQRLATAAARQDDSIVVLRMALTSEADCMLRCNRKNHAKRCIDEGLALEDEDSLSDELGNAWLRILEGQYYADLGRAEEARNCLQRIWPYLKQAQKMTIAAGVHAAMRAWWTVEARCCETVDNSAGEVASLSLALEIAKHIESLPHAASVYTKARLSKVLGQLAAALWRNGQFDQARSAKSEADNLRIRLKLPKLRSSF